MGPGSLGLPAPPLPGPAQKDPDPRHDVSLPGSPGVAPPHGPPRRCHPFYRGGQACHAQPRLPLLPSRWTNQASWERNEAAKITLSRVSHKFATWIWQGIVEMVARGCPLSLFIEPLGAADKATSPFWRLILDARISNEYQDPYLAAGRPSRPLRHHVCRRSRGPRITSASSPAALVALYGLPCSSLTRTVKLPSGGVLKWAATHTCAWASATRPRA